MLTKTRTKKTTDDKNQDTKDILQKVKEVLGK